MKKTLIAMFALAGVAMADSDLTWTLYGNPASETLRTSGATGFAFDINAGADYRKAVYGPEGYADQSKLTLDTIKITTTAESVGCNFVLIGPLSVTPATINKGSLLGFIAANDVTLNLGVATLDFSGQSITLAPDTGYRVICTTADYSTTEVGTEITLANLTTFNMQGYQGADPQSGAHENSRAHLGFIGGGLGVGLNQPDVPLITMTLKTTTVPEPATATLSLLALAGLAARRRRH